MLGFDVQLPQNLAEHLHRFQVSTHYQGRKRHTSRMLGFRGKATQVTSVMEEATRGHGGDFRHLELSRRTRYGRNGSPPQGFAASESPLRQKGTEDVITNRQLVDRPRSAGSMYRA